MEWSKILADLEILWLLRRTLVLYVLKLNEEMEHLIIECLRKKDL